MNVLVTGGAGFIGTNLVQYLANQACEEYDIEISKIISFDKLTYAGNRANLDNIDDERHVFIKGDICDGVHVAEVLREYEIHTIIHLAAETHVDRSIDTPEDFVSTNVLGTFQLLNAFKDYRDSLSADVLDSERMLFLHVSTDEVFGSLNEEDPAFTELTPYAPNSPYSASKAASDHLVRSYFQTYELPVIITHCSNNYGPFQFPEKLIPLMIQKILKNEPLPVYGNGENIRDWLYVTDHCRGIVSALASGKIGVNYVIGGRCEIKNIDLIHKLISVVHKLAPSSAVKTAEELISFVDDRPGHDKRYAIDASYISEELGWQPLETFTSGLKKTVEWYINNPQWIEGISTEAYQGQRLGTTIRK